MLNNDSLEYGYKLINFRDFFVFQVNNNGHLSFDYEVPVYLPTLRLGSRYKLIAAFLSDIDTSAAGSVYYRFVFSSGVALN